MRPPLKAFFETFTFYTTFSLFLTISEVSNISNKDWLPNRSATKLLLHRTPDTVYSFQWETCALKFVLSIAQVFRNIHLLPHASLFSQWMRCAVFQIYTDLLVTHQNFNIFTQHVIYPSISWEKNWRFPSQILFEPSTFYSIFTILKSEWDL